jgi:hypothetical protein
VNIHAPNNKSVQVLGIDAGGTMTDTFFVDSDGDFVVGKAQSTPLNEALGLIASSEDGLSNWGLSLGAALKQLQTGVYSGTAMLNRVVQRKGLRYGLTVNRGSPHSINRSSSRCKVTPSGVAHSEPPTRSVAMFTSIPAVGFQARARCVVSKRWPGPFLFFIFLQNTTRQVVGHSLCAAIAAPPST